MERDVRVTLDLAFTTTEMSREEIIRHALEIITNSYESSGIAVLKDSCTVHEE